jgi:hypothetical protein
MQKRPSPNGDSLFEIFSLWPLAISCVSAFGFWLLAIGGKLLEKQKHLIKNNSQQPTANS